MLDASGWRRVLPGLISATGDGRITWEERDGLNIASIAMTLIRPGFIPARIFTASAGGVHYELSSSPLGEPYHITASETRGGKNVNLGTRSSTTSVNESGSFEVNQLLAALFDAVDATIETSDEVADRILRSLGEA